MSASQIKSVNATAIGSSRISPQSEDLGFMVVEQMFSRLDVPNQQYQNIR